MALTNAERQALWRARRDAEIKRLRKVAAKAPLDDDDSDPVDQPAHETAKRQKRRRRGALSNAERQAQWRAKRDAELAALRKTAAKIQPTKAAPVEHEDFDSDDHPVATSRRRRRRKRKRDRHERAAPKPQRRFRPEPQYADEQFGAVVDYWYAIMKYARRIPPLPERPVDHNWLRSPDPRDVAKLKEDLDYLVPKFDEFKALLKRAEEVLARKSKR